MRIRIRTVVPTLLLTLVFVAASTITPIVGKSPNEDVVITSTSIVSPTGEVRTSVTPGICGPIDLTIALDDTGTMGGAIGNIKAELPAIISTATIASGGDLMVGYMTFKDLVDVRNNLTTNISAVMDSINATFAGGGDGAPESSDEAKNTSVNNLPAGTRPDAAGNLGTQIGNYTTPYRAGATKIVVLITDAPPGGFNDVQDAADNTSLNTTHPLTALSKGIKVSDVFVPTGGDYAGQAALLEKDANTTGGAFITTAANGSGTGAAITKVIEACGGPTIKGSISGMKFNDLNGNGTKDTGEPGLANWTITLRNESGSMVTNITDANGNYSFTDLPDGNYTVGEILKAGWTQTAPSTGTYTVEIKGDNEVTDKDFGNMRPPPEAACIETVNPAGKHIPTAGANPKSGQNPDGFYELLAVDLLDPNPMVYVKDAGSGTIFGPFPSGTKIKYTESSSDPVSKTIGGPNSAVDWHIKGNGDAKVYAVNVFGMTSSEVDCLVPPPPK